MTYVLLALGIVIAGLSVSIGLLVHDRRAIREIRQRMAVEKAMRIAVETAIPLNVGTRVCGHAGWGTVARMGAVGVTVQWDKGGPETMTMRMAEGLLRLRAS